MPMWTTSAASGVGYSPREIGGASAEAEHVEARMAALRRMRCEVTKGVANWSGVGWLKECSILRALNAAQGL